jgi:hypothetical protein
MSRAGAILLYLTLSVPFGIAVHLGAEFAGLGRDAEDLAFSPLHGYLALIAVLALLGFLIMGGFFASSAERRRRLGLLAGALPFHGRGPGFFAFSAGLQFAFFAVTQLGEGCPVCKGDLLVGVLAATVASIVGAFALIELRRQIVRAFTTLNFERRNSCAGGAQRLPRHAMQLVASIYSTFADTLGNRPPPSTLPATTR